MKAISVEGLSKQYRLGRTGYGTARHDLQSWWARVRGRQDPNARVQGPASVVAETGADRFWALRDVSFTVEEGEIVGVIGRNGAGKSTLLKIMSRVTVPTRGLVRVNGRVSSLLEVGTGFHPELTGRENVYLNGALLGMTKREVRAKFDEIVAFAEMERFIDTPVKRYSSGMQVRLAFAVAGHLEPEILLVDEVLAVGDAQFQRKCLGKISEVSRQGRTVLFVSHNLGTIAKLCERGVVLDGGEIVADAPISEAVRTYATRMNSGDGAAAPECQGTLDYCLRFTGVKVNGRPATYGFNLHPSEPIAIAIAGEALDRIPAFRVSVCIYRDGQLLITRHDVHIPEDLPPGAFVSEVELPPWFLGPGDYTLTAGGYSHDRRQWLWTSDHMTFSVATGWAEHYDTDGTIGMVNLPDRGTRTFALPSPHSVAATAPNGLRS